MTMNTDWNSTTTEWGEAAYEEMKAAFPGKLKSRSVALCAWCYGHDPNVSEAEIEAIAQADPVIVAQRQQKRISAQGRNRAKALLGLDQAATEVRDPNLSDFEHALRTNLREGSTLLDEFQKCEGRMRRAEKALAKARAGLHEILPEIARDLAAADAAAHAVLAAEGLLAAMAPEAGEAMPDPEPTVDQAFATAEPVAAPPAGLPSELASEPTTEPADELAAESAASDIAFDLLRKKVTTAPRETLAEVDDESEPASTPSDSVLIEDDFYTIKEEQHPEQFLVVWPKKDD